jgi:hypothetical protein
MDFKKRAEEIIIKVWNPLGDKPLKQWMMDNIETGLRESYNAGMMRAAEMAEEQYVGHTSEEITNERIAHATRIAEAIRKEAGGENGER